MTSRSARGGRPGRSRLIPRWTCSHSGSGRFSTTLFMTRAAGADRADGGGRGVSRMAGHGHPGPASRPDGGCGGKCRLVAEAGGERRRDQRSQPEGAVAVPGAAATVHRPGGDLAGRGADRSPGIGAHGQLRRGLHGSGHGGTGGAADPPGGGTGGDPLLRRRDGGHRGAAAGGAAAQPGVGSAERFRTSARRSGCCCRRGRGGRSRFRTGGRWAPR